MTHVRSLGLTVFINTIQVGDSVKVEMQSGRKLTIDCLKSIV